MDRDPHARLVALFAEEHRRAAAAEAHVLADEIRRRHGAAVQAVLFYGSCLRRDYVAGGVLDFYVVVDSYRAAYSSRLLALANALLPPNVYYVELPREGDALRMKYNVISAEDFAAACRPESSHAIVWARFCQPAVVVHARDERVRDRLAAEAAEAALTMISRMLALHAGAATTEALWQAGFASTYATELRPEVPETIRTVYEADPERYDRVAALAVEVLARQNLVSGKVEGKALEVSMAAATRAAIVAAWRRKIAVAKVVYALRLVKSAVTFGDWLPYALWKLARHTGVRVTLTERQRRHPLLFGWPVIFRLLRGQILR